MATEGITHRTVPVNGINMHVAEKGEGPTIVGLAARGYRAVAPDLRGFGDTDAQPSVEAYSIFHLVGDLVALIDALGQEQLCIAGVRRGARLGAIVAWHLCLFRPDRVKALVNISVAFSPRKPNAKPVETLRSIYGDEHYIARFQFSGTRRSREVVCETRNGICAQEALRVSDTWSVLLDGGVIGSPDHQVPLPPWLSEEDIRYFADKFEQSGFTGGINYYRSLDRNWELSAPWTGAQVKVPTKFIVGDLDLSYHTPGVQNFIHKGGLKKFVPLLEEVVVMEGVGHFLNQEKPSETTDHIFDFIKNF
ncbi:unnamed protein product [Spirodela intermedia]|uniref:AB hydrolase-1 domain-containing protein n=1 Tax=Spirodela intermedia TaxID=51605 RepID=A0A7I8IUU7_SPIIN|nr:unnamed protein product [Spirodela intermedia]CAA6661529.1 unnamed protein product [Spirodela intermedia]